MKCFHPISFLLIVAMMACNNRLEEKPVYVVDIETISEDNNLALENVPEKIQQWLDFYHQYDTAFLLKNFKASGVVLHLNDLKSLDTLSDINKDLYTLFSFSPDKKKYIDIWSYGNLIPPDEMQPSKQKHSFNDGEADQQIVLGEQSGKRNEIMFNGPAQVVEAADWINNNQFLITMFTEEENEMVVEIYLFDLEKNVFTNFRLTHDFKLPQNKPQSFSDYWLGINKKHLDKR
jgi:hypothetical protein